MDRGERGKAGRTDRLLPSESGGKLPCRNLCFMNNNDNNHDNNKNNNRSGNYIDKDKDDNGELRIRTIYQSPIIITMIGQWPKRSNVSFSFSYLCS
jgi:hypothetical protein